MIVFPMAGLSSRFTQAGYTQPKYMLPLADGTVFSEVLDSFKNYFLSHSFLFICRDVSDTKSFVRAQSKRLGISDFEITVLDHATLGQADTVYQGIKSVSLSKETPLTIFNIDTLRPGLYLPTKEELGGADGYLEVFEGEGNAWSFAKTVSRIDMTVVETAEKRRISDLCSTGLYHFAEAGDFMEAFDDQKSKPKEAWDAQELYVAPLYNHLISRGRNIRALPIPKDQFVPCGTPAEYRHLRESATSAS